MPSPRQRRAGCAIVVVLALAALLLGWTSLQRMMRDHPERFPWTPLSLADPVGPFTGMKLSRLTGDAERCRGLLGAADLAERAFEQPRPRDDRCIIDDGVILRPESSGSINYAPAGPVTSCPVAAALSLWERDVVQPAAQRHFGSRVVRIDHAGSYSCRRLYGRSAGRFSEHATADAIDILGFRLADGRRVTILRDWDEEPERRLFLRDVRDGACDLFSTVLSPDYNEAHADHFHLDQAGRGKLGWRVCR